MKRTFFFECNTPLLCMTHLIFQLVFSDPRLILIGFFPHPTSNWKNIIFNLQNTFLVLSFLLHFVILQHCHKRLLSYIIFSYVHTFIVFSTNILRKLENFFKVPTIPLYILKKNNKTLYTEKSKYLRCLVFHYIFWKHWKFSSACFFTFSYTRKNSKNIFSPAKG